MGVQRATWLIWGLSVAVAAPLCHLNISSAPGPIELQTSALASLLAALRGGLPAAVLCLRVAVFNSVCYLQRSEGGAAWEALLAHDRAGWSERRAGGVGSERV
jgi:hypothetical protein